MFSNLISLEVQATTALAPYQRDGMGLLEHQVMPALRDLAHDGWLCTFIINSQPGGPLCLASPLAFGLIGPYNARGGCGGGGANIETLVLSLKEIVSRDGYFF